MAKSKLAFPGWSFTIGNGEPRIPISSQALLDFWNSPLESYIIPLLSRKTSHLCL